MKIEFRTIKVSESSKISEIVSAFAESQADLILIDENSVFSQPHLELLTDYPRKTATALVAPLYEGETRVVGGRVTGAASSFHTAGGGNSTFAGALRLSQSQREDVITALNAIENSGVKGHPLDLILVALVRAGIHVASAQIVFAPYIRSNDSEAYEFSRGDFWSIFAGALLLQLSIIVDCVDGELARYTRRFSQLGAWLDAITDRIKEYLVFFGLAYGAARDGNDLWIPAMAMMVFQAVRHLSDYNFARIHKVRSTDLPIIDFKLANDGFVPIKKAKKSRLQYWAKKAIQFPIGERWLVISASAVIGGAAFTFTVMPILAAISIIAVFRSRIRVTRSWPKERINTELIVDQLDTFKNPKSTNRFDWLEPSILRAIEGAVVICLTIVADLNRPAAFLLLFAIIFGHYDNLYRALQGEHKPKWLSYAGTFIIGRILILGIFIIFSWSIAPLVWYFGVLFLVVSSIQWIAGEKSRIA